MIVTTFARALQWLLDRAERRPAVSPGADGVIPSHEIVAALVERERAREDAALSAVNASRDVARKPPILALPNRDLPLYSPREGGSGIPSDGSMPRVRVVEPTPAPFPENGPKETA